MIIKEFIETRYEQNDYNAKDTYEDIKELIEEIRNDPDKLANALERNLEEFCEEEEICELCGAPLGYSTYEEPHEYMGSECFETMVELYCPNGCVHQ